MTLIDRLHAPGTMHSALMMIPDVHVASALAGSGLDFVTVDGEHGDFTPDSMRTCAAALQEAGALVAVRPPTNGEDDIRAALALRVDGILVPHVESAGQAAAIVELAHAAGAAALVIVESALGVENAAAIATVPGLDGIMVGPGDLSADLGVPGQFEDERVRGGIEHVAEQAIAAGVKVSLWRTPRTDAERDALLVYGFSDTSILDEAARIAVERARSESAALGMHHVGLSVVELERSLAFYRDLLGFEVTAHQPFEGDLYETIMALPGTYGRAAMLAGPGLQLELFEFTHPAPDRSDPERPVSGHGITHFCLTVGDVDAEYDRLSAAGVSFHCPPLDFGTAKATYLRDPDGNVIELLQLTGRSR
jgi:2-keto-3-deoxy-L-rhamnonate aldolase RhmA/catechol 2,3-dioxygenase-like lactoylglutathione lyase family enzyme